MLGKMPAGYKVAALSKSMCMVTTDNGISFKRMVGEDNRYIAVRYVIDYAKTHYSKDEYPQIRQFYLQMHDMLSEQIVLKKI